MCKNISTSTIYNPHLKAISSYITSIFLLPITLIDGIEKMILAFWWGHGGTTNKGIHWLYWDMLTFHKNYRGWDLKIRR